MKSRLLGSALLDNFDVALGQAVFRYGVEKQMDENRPVTRSLRYAAKRLYVKPQSGGQCRLCRCKGRFAVEG